MITIYFKIKLKIFIKTSITIIEKWLILFFYFCDVNTSDKIQLLFEIKFLALLHHIDGNAFYGFIYFFIYFTSRLQHTFHFLFIFFLLV